MKTDKNEQLGLRVSSDVKEEYKEFCDAHKCAQGEGLAILLQLQRLQDAAEANPERAEILADFDYHIKALVTLQEASLVLAEDAGRRAKEGFAIQLEQNTQLIRSLQETIIAKETIIASLNGEKAIATEERDNFMRRVSELEDRNAYAQDQLRDKDQRINALTEELAEIKGLPKRYQSLLEEVNDLRRENKALSDQMKDAEIAHVTEIRKLEGEKHQAQLDAAHLKARGDK